MITTRLLTSIAEISPAEWNSIVGHDRLTCRHEFLLAVEKCRINDCRYFYPVVYDDKGIIAHTSVYYISTELDLFAKGIVKSAIQQIRKFWPSFLILRSIECGTPVALGNTISYRGREPSKEVMLDIAEAIERLAMERKVAVLLIRDFYENELPFNDCLLEIGYRRIHNLPATRMEIKWSNFQDYLSSMRSQYRCKLLVQQKRFRNSGATIEFVKDFSVYADECARLWRNVYDRATEYKREILLPDFFENMDKYLGDRSGVLIARKGNDIVGFLLLFINDDILVPIFCGLDYSCSTECGVYFNLFYESVILAMNLGMKEIEFGITTIEPKLDLGAVVTPLYMYMKHLKPVMNKVVPRLFDVMTPQTSLYQRHVFKK